MKTLEKEKNNNEKKKEKNNQLVENKSKKDLEEKIEKSKNRIPDESLNKIFYNVLLAIIVMLYFFIINIAYNRMPIIRLEKDISIFSGIFLVLGIFFLERAYKTDNSKKVITAIEFFILSAHSLSIMHIIKKYGFDFQIYLTASAYTFSIYYTLKSIIIYVRAKKQILDDLSDVKEIVKKEEPIKKEAKKRMTENKDSNIKKDNIKNNKTTKKTVIDKNVKKTPEKKNTVQKSDSSKALAKNKEESKKTSDNKIKQNKKTNKNKEENKND